MIKAPPHSIEIEQWLIGAVLFEGEQALDRLDGLPVEAFYHGHFRAIYASALKLRERREPVDLMTVSMALGPDRLESVGGMVTLTQCLESLVSTVNLETMTRAVSDNHKRRQLISALTTALDGAYDQTLALEDLQTQLETGLTSALNQTQKGGLRHISEILPKVFAELESGKSPAQPTGINYLDQCLNGGFRPGELILIAARPGMGKSFLASYVARVLAESNPVAFFSLEMDDLQVVKRMLSSESKILGSALNSNKVSADDMDALFGAYSTLESLPIYVDDTPGSQLTINRLISECHRIYRKHGALGAVVVDYLQLMGDSGAANRVAELGRFSFALKSLAKELSCPVLALSQLSRNVETRNDKRPILADLRESGCLEQDADVTIFLYRDEYYNPNTPDQGILELLIRKNRGGPTGTARAVFKPEIGAIENYKDYQ